MPVIRVDDDVFEALQKQAIPLVDTPNSVLRRLLGLAGVVREDHREKGARRVLGRSRGGTGRGAYRVPILRALVSLGGRAQCRDVLERVEQRLRNNMTAADRETLPSKQRLRWQENAEWERYFMVKDGLLASGSPRGTWEITEEGRRYLQGHGSS